MGVNKRGFTLIELLLAVSIMALLIGVLLPALASAREAARQAACLANVNQLLLATLAYAADRRDRLPVGPATPSLLDPATSWDRFFCNWLWIGPTRQPTGHGVLMVEGYLIDRSAVVCPGADQPEVYAADLDALRQSTLDVFSAYAYRSYDQTTRARIDDLGFNGAGHPHACSTWTSTATDPRACCPRRRPTTASASRRWATPTATPGSLITPPATSPRKPSTTPRSQRPRWPDSAS